MSTCWSTNCSAMNGKYKCEVRAFLIVFYGTKWSGLRTPYYLLNILFCRDYSYGNGGKSRHHFNRLLLCDRNDTSTRLSAGSRQKVNTTFSVVFTVRNWKLYDVLFKFMRSWNKPVCRQAGSPIIIHSCIKICYARFIWYSSFLLLVKLILKPINYRLLLDLKTFESSQYFDCCLFVEIMHPTRLLLMAGISMPVFYL